MFVTIIIYALLATHVAAEIPSYINICGHRNPNIDQCILDNINNLKSKICDGIPELNIPSNNPFIIDKIVISNTTNSKLFLKDAKLTGLCDFVINYFYVDLDKLYFKANISFQRIQMNSTYDFDVRLLIPIVHKGLIYITTDMVESQIDLNMKIITKNGKRYIYVSKIKLNIDIQGYDAKYEMNKMEFNQVTQIVDNFIGKNKKEIIKSIKPVLEEVISKQIILISNNIVKNFTYEELFPDRI